MPDRAAAAVVPGMKSECRSCMLAEMSLRQRLVYLVWERYLRPKPGLVAVYCASISGVLRTMTGAREPTCYERHRSTYEQTGDPLELVRMLRHVGDAEGGHV